MIDEAVERRIQQRLREAEREHGVRVLYAVESGSRAWGTASPNSDHDVRFVYAHPRDWYLAVDVEARRDVIEYPVVDDLEVGGWDLRKALRLFHDSNPSLIEWLYSPIVYTDEGGFAARARALVPRLYSVDTGMQHYRHMAERNYRGYLKAQLVPLKKYFYVLRPLLAVRWLERFRTPPPLEFGRLRELVSEEAVLDRDIGRLLARKQRAGEKEFVPVIPALNDFIENELARLARAPARDAGPPGDMEALNALFRDSLSAS